ncbi:M48 family metallopeptidase [Paenibacillus sp. N3.4]|uniref:M48 family metallopeptidase n=1 Tax=Paenibacillus sp. N3.4 TaxID=2603222 RepID=UPI0011C86095|nr:M48 family metallopeptidase [Paenibacillus sp. N3.4]TXK83965.1 M48 family metalloprotease [Paenibacillus sp. N3.4]
MKSMVANTDEKVCPDCNHVMEDIKGYVTWCEKCNWNLKTAKKYVPKSIFEKIYLRAGEKSGQNLLHSLLQKENLNPTFFSLKLLTLVASSFIHLASLCIFVSGFYLIKSDFPNVLFIILGISLMVLAWITRLKPNKLRHPPLSREHYPNLYKFTDEISSTLNADKVYGIIIDEKFNASFSQIGWKQKKILRLGLPLLSVLNKQELVALISHEIAHGINGDLNKGLWVGSAIHTLSSWYQITKPDKIFDTRYRAGALFMIFANILLLLVSKILYFLLYLLCHLNWRDSQRAEYLADQIAAKTAGKEAILSLLNKLHFQDSYEFTILKVINTKREGHFFEDFVEQVLMTPEKELERIKRLELLDNSRLDATHPPTGNRITYINSLDLDKANFIIKNETYQLIMNEISELHLSIEKSILDDYKLRYIQF